MNFIDGILIFAVAVLLGYALRRIQSKKKNGCCGNSCSCCTSKCVNNVQNKKK